MKYPQNLFKRGDKFSVRYTVPTEWQPLVGRKEIVRSLKTSDLRTAVLRRDAILSEIRQSAERALAGESIDTPTSEDRFGTGRNVKRFSEVAERWLRSSDGVAGSTLRRYRQHLEEFSEWSGNVDIAKIDRALALSFADYLKTKVSKRTGERLSERSINSYLICLSSFWRVLDHWGLVDPDMRNPFAGLNRRIPGQKRKSIDPRKKTLRPVTREDAQGLLERIESGTNVYRREMAVIVRLLWSTGCRLNEICSLMLTDIDDKGDHIELTIREAKTDAGNRIVTLVDPQDVSLLRATRDLAEISEPLDHRNEGLLFPRLRRGGYDAKPSWYVGKALEAARKADPKHDGSWDMHSFRRNAVSALINAGVAKEARNLVIGHSNKDDIGMDVYAKHGDLREIVLVTFKALISELKGPLRSTQ